MTSFINNITHTKINTSVIGFFDYSRDAIGNRTEVRSPSSITSYDYDDNNQLIASDSSASLNESFVYDPLGNRITDVNGNYVYDDKFQRIKEDYQFLYTFDDDGNLNGKISKNDQQNYDIYVHNSENKLISIRTFTANVLSKEVNYTYDALGRRVEKQILNHQDSTKDFTRRFVYDGSEALMELDDTNTILATYTHSTLRTDDVLSIDVTSDGVTKGRALASGSFYYLKDAQGTITDITDGNGDLIQHYDYLSFGKLYKVTGPTGNDITSLPTIDPYFSYTNREYDKESGLYYYRARYYNAGVGRFLQEDPHTGRLTSPLSHVSKYIYTLNRPTGLVDPSGMFGISGAILGGVVLGVLDPLGVVSGSIRGIEKASKYLYKKKYKLIGIGLMAAGAYVTVVSGGSLSILGAGLIGAGIGAYRTSDNATWKDAGKNATIGGAIGGAIAIAPSGFLAKAAAGFAAGFGTSVLLGGNTEDNLSSGKAGAISGASVNLFGGSSNGNSSSNKEINWAGGRLIKN